MNKIDYKILNLLYQGIDLESLKTQTGLSSTNLALKLTSLRNLGFNIKRKYYSNSDILTISKSLEEEKFTQINVKQKFRFLAIADTHYGSKYEKCELTEEAFDYAVVNGIHYIFHAGDFFEGMYLINGLKNPNSKSKSSIDEAYRFLKKYPKDPSIHTMGVFGNHDIRSQISDGLDLKKFIETYRPDITILGKEFGAIKTGEDFIVLHHPIHTRYKRYDESVHEYSDRNNINTKIVVRGHLHSLDSYTDERKNIVLTTSSLSEPIEKCGGWDVTIEYARVGNKTEMYEVIYVPLTFKNKLVENSAIYKKILH